MNSQIKQNQSDVLVIGGGNAAWGRLIREKKIIGE
jgi:hypothetical protein